jgi:cyclase
MQFNLSPHVGSGISRRDLLVGGATLAAVGAVSSTASRAQSPAPQVGPSPIELAPGVFALVANGDHVWCNIVWVVFRDHVLLLDAGRLSEAEAYLPIIQSTSSKPIRFVLNTHHHGDHSYANDFWMQHGAVIMGNSRILGEFARDEPYRLEHFPTLEPRWKAELALTHVRPPSMLLSSPMVFDDGSQRVELLYLGAAHTAADTIAWLPRQKILVAGDIVVNGPYNVMWDAHVLNWIDVLAKAEALGAVVVVPGHGAPGPGSLIAGQRAYFIALRNTVKHLVSRHVDAKELRASVKEIQQSLVADPRIRRWVVAPNFPLPELLSLSGQLGQFYTELTGKPYVAMDSPEYLQGAAAATLCCGALKGLA